MLKPLSAAAAALLISIAPALAEPSLQDRSKDQAPGQTQTEDQNQAVAPPDEQSSDDDIQIIILGKSMQIQVPNPYENPKPRMITDAWAMRA